jgi:hypothetical protein
MSDTFTLAELWEYLGAPFYTKVPGTGETCHVAKFLGNTFIVTLSGGERAFMMGTSKGWTLPPPPEKLTPAERKAKQEEERKLQNEQITKQLRRETALKNTRFVAKDGKIRVVKKFTVIEGGKGISEDERN